MKLKAILERLVPNIILERYRSRHDHENISKFKFDVDGSSDVKGDIQEKFGHNSELLEFFASNKEYVVHKWHHYIPLYDRYFSSFRGRKIRFLEIGVGQGGSLQMWRKYFGDEAIIFGIDINPKCEKFNGLAGQVRIGSQTDGLFLESVVKEMGGVDIVLDDGSHHMAHFPVTLKYLFPLLKYGGIYMIEDLHTAYWKRFGGGYRAMTNFFAFIMDLVDDMHHWYHAMGLKQAVISKDCSGIHIHDSIVVLDKNKVHEPVHSQNG
ncbi:MAG: class I SAM-dependent methyltransferase [Anaerolineales bacterium]|nr:class I SAM-dependent methyltransferase [Anaerolineales bacterium]